MVKFKRLPSASRLKLHLVPGSWKLLQDSQSQNSRPAPQTVKNQKPGRQEGGEGGSTLLPEPAASTGGTLKGRGKSVTAQGKTGFKSWLPTSSQVRSKGCVGRLAAPRLLAEPDTPSFSRGSLVLVPFPKSSLRPCSPTNQAGGELPQAVCATGQESYPKFTQTHAKY